MRLPRSNDSRLLLAGVVAFVALVAYVAVAFANTHVLSAGTSKVAPWTTYQAIAVPVRLGKRGKYAVHLVPTRAGTYGGLVSNLVSNPTSGHTYLVGLWIKGSTGGPVGVEIDEFAPGATSVYVVDTTVTVGPKWHHYTFKVPVKGTWLGLGMYLHRETSREAKTSFVVKGLTAALGAR